MFCRIVSSQQQTRTLWPSSRRIRNRLIKRDESSEPHPGAVDCAQASGLSGHEQRPSS